MATKDQNGATWNVTGQQQATQLGQGGTFERGYNVSFMTGLGHQGTVFVKEGIYANTEAVRQLIQTAADATDAVGTLTSG